MNGLRSKLRFTAIILTAFLMVGTLSTKVPAEETIRLGGAGSGLGTMKILAEAFEKSHPGAKVTVLPNLGSSGGIKALLHGAIDLAISGRALKAEESRAGVVAVDCARTPFVFIANRNVGKADLTSRELENIYNGRMSRWGDGTRIRLILRPSSDTDTSIIKSASKGMEQALKIANSRPDMIVAVTDQEAVEAVEKIPGALGAATLAQIKTEHPSVKVLSFNGITPTLDTLAKGSYRLSKPLFLISSPKTSATGHRFIKFVQSAAGRAILARSDALPTIADSDGK